MARYVLCQGGFTQLTNGNIRCEVPMEELTENQADAYVESIIAQYLIDNPTNPPFDPLTIDATVATALFTGGFVIAIIPWATAWGFSQLLNFVKQF